MPGNYAADTPKFKSDKEWAYWYRIVEIQQHSRKGNYETGLFF